MNQLLASNDMNNRNNDDFNGASALGLAQEKSE